ncbi:heptaprenylglyceryl phosphate synthase [Paenibacillus sp. CGMCC 1.16610]|uniref:Heptaprenylglyceryl phosphate synthase n=1 Tax=Paenibacillus anseongense TaxID=2682845 RepID=A0ABW9U2X1_9BACL|nr:MULTISPECIES: heptaprenylglyceryl phosphate synthase [Paenibacillus]MBA2942347.1 heptaprenylglyceryl phosphate synthase [Paenibacillus sp. CGMCC 1.16610]MVQ34422.1 heptaprenylglyceryl phosphate synthase [Paenibacillus anseongense]
MIVDIRKWNHVFKLDPDRDISDEALDLICQSGTDAIMVGGSTGVTFDNTVDLMARIRQYELPCVLEISSQEAIVPGFDLYFIPVVLNAEDPNWIVGQHHEALKEYGSLLNWDEIVTEGYVILNSEAAAAKLTKARANLDAKDVAAYARMADKLFNMPIVYLEYSGVFGDMELVRRTRQVLENARLFYGGGIDSLAKAQQAAEVADTIVVGNIIYSDLEQALQTVNVNFNRTGR